MTEVQTLSHFYPDSIIDECLLFSPGTLSCRGWMTEADVASRCPKNTHLTGPVGSDTRYSLTTREKMSAV